MQLLYKAQTQLGREVYVALLERLCDTSQQVAREATDWLLYAEDEVSSNLLSCYLITNAIDPDLQRKFNVPVTSLLLRTGLIPTELQDQQLAKLILRDGKPSAINFKANLIRECVFAPNPTATREHFRRSIEALTQVA